MTKSGRIKLSVCMISYKQENYIEQSLMSAVNQETEFDFEVVIGELLKIR